MVLTISKGCSSGIPEGKDRGQDLYPRLTTVKIHVFISVGYISTIDATNMELSLTLTENFLVPESWVTPRWVKNTYPRLNIHVTVHVCVPLGQNNTHSFDARDQKSTMKLT